MGGPGGVIESLDETNEKLGTTNGELSEINETIEDAKRTAANLNLFDLNKEVGEGEPVPAPR